MPLTRTVGVFGALLIGGAALLAFRTPSQSAIELVGTPSPYLLIFAGDLDEAESDFISVFDANPDSDKRGEPLHSMPTGMKGSMPHHTEYSPPPVGEPLFMNAHHHELSMMVDISNLASLKIQKTLPPPAPFRFPHDYTRTPNGTRLVGFLRGEGTSPDPKEDMIPANHGGIAEYSKSGELLRTASAAVDTIGKAIRPYAFSVLPEIDRFIVTSAPMMERSWAEVLQIYSYSDFELLHTLKFPTLETEQVKEGFPMRATGFGPRVLNDGSVFVSTYECSFYHLTGIETERPKLELVHTVAEDGSGHAANHCGIPVQVNKFWLQPVAKNHSIVVLDIENPQRPREVFRLKTPDDFNPHWLSKDPQSNRLILGAELGGEQGFYILRVDEETGALDFDDDFNALKDGFLFKSKSKGYLSLARDEWPHGSTGSAWGHAALFLDRPYNPDETAQLTDGTEYLFAAACLPLKQSTEVIQ